MLGANKATDSTALALRRLVKVKPLAGYIGLRNANGASEMNVRACLHQENLLLSRCEGEYAKTFFFIFAKGVVSTLAVG